MSADRPTPWWASLGLWRALAFAGFTLAAALLVTMFAPRAERTAEEVVVVFAGSDARPALIAAAERGNRHMTLKAVAPLELAGDRALELWLQPEGKPPLSLGLVAPTGITRIAMRAPVGIALQRVSALAISLEPSGGSPTGAPTGPLLYTGRVELLY